MTELLRSGRLTPQQLDSTLYSAFAEETSVIFKPLNQYYVILEVAPPVLAIARGLRYLSPHSKGPCRSTASRISDQYGPAVGAHSGLFSFCDGIVNLGTSGASDAVRMISQMEERLERPPPFTLLRRHLAAYQSSLSTEPVLIATALLAVYIGAGYSL